MNLFVIVHVNAIFLLRQEVCLFIEGCIELQDFLLLELGLFFKFVVVFDQVVDVIFQVGLVDWLIVKQSVNFLELSFESDKLEIGLFSDLRIFSNLLKESFPFSLDPLDLSFQCCNILVEHFDLFCRGIAHFRIPIGKCKCEKLISV